MRYLRPGVAFVLGAVVFALVVLATMSRSTEAEKPIRISQLSLRDVHGLWGGQNVYISADRTLWVQVVSGSSHEQRYKLMMTEAQLGELEKLLGESHFPDIQIKERPGVPDEARPAIKLVTPDGKTMEKVKWANDKNPQFDAIYKKLLSLIPAKGTQTPVFEGPFDRNWHPEHF